MPKNYTCHGVTDKCSRKELKGWKKSYKLLVLYANWKLEIFLAGEWGTLSKDMGEIGRMLKALIKSLENKRLNP